jgi:type IV pilus biogenesis protein CpaD/CtpE
MRHIDVPVVAPQRGLMASMNQDLTKGFLDRRAATRTHGTELRLLQLHKASFVRRWIETRRGNVSSGDWVDPVLLPNPD